MTQLEPEKPPRRGRAVPVRARPDAVPTPASLVEWFVTAQSTCPQMVDGRLMEWPSSLVHAKRMGSNLTACGLHASSWPKLFHMSFPPGQTETCQECATQVRTARS